MLRNLMNYSSFKIYPDLSIKVDDVVLIRAIGHFQAGASFKSAILSVWDMTLKLRNESEPDCVVDVKFELED